MIYSLELVVYCNHENTLYKILLSNSSGLEDDTKVWQIWKWVVKDLDSDIGDYVPLDDEALMQQLMDMVDI